MRSVYIQNNNDGETIKKYLGEGNEGENSHDSEHYGGDQHNDGRANISAEKSDGGQPATEIEKHKEEIFFSLTCHLKSTVHENIVCIQNIA